MITHRLPRVVALALVGFTGCDQRSTANANHDPWAGSAGDRAPAPSGADPWSTGAGSAPSAPDPWTAGAPAAPPSPTAPGVAASAGADTSGIDGTWTCAFISSTWQNGMLITQPLTMPGFAISGRSYTSNSGSGTIDYDGSYVSFHGAGFDGWRAAMSTHQDGSRYLVFSGDTHRDAKPGDGARNRDIKCELRH